MSELKTSYDQVAEGYAETYFHELDGKPIDRGLLDRFAAAVKGRGPVCDLGCGPAQIARYLVERGVDALGLDLSPRMVRVARRLNPELEILEGDMVSLPFAGASLAGIVAFYSLIHVPPKDHQILFHEVRRVLQPGGLFLFSFHTGDGVRHLDVLEGSPASADFHFFRVPQMELSVAEAGFDTMETLERPPYPEIEYQSQRGYILAQRPSGEGS
jgi:SAM-dependent methyltransferase